jgi:hypothetical protein
MLWRRRAQSTPGQRWLSHQTGDSIDTDPTLESCASPMLGLVGGVWESESRSAETVLFE